MHAQPHTHTHTQACTLEMCMPDPFVDAWPVSASPHPATREFVFGAAGPSAPGGCVAVQYFRVTHVPPSGVSPGCPRYIGELGSGNYVKMVHNGIEYGDMQLIAEAYDVLKSVSLPRQLPLTPAFVPWAHAK